MKIQEYVDLCYRIEKERDYYNTSDLPHTDEFLAKQDYYNALYNQKVKWEMKVIEKALKGLDKDFFMSV